MKTPDPCAIILHSAVLAGGFFLFLLIIWPTLFSVYDFFMLQFSEVMSWVSS